MSANQAKVILLLTAAFLLAGCAEDAGWDTKGDRDLAEPIPSHSDTTNMKSQGNVSITDQVPFSLAAAGCDGVGIVVEMPTATGFPFPAPIGWETEPGVFVDQYWLYLVKCDRVVAPDGSVHVDTFVGWDGHTNFSADGKNVNGQWGVFLSIMNFYGSESLRHSFEDYDQSFTAIEKISQTQGVEPGLHYLIETSQGTVRVNEPRTPILDETTSPISYTDKWLVSGNRELVATLESTEHIKGASVSGMAAASGSHPLTVWPMKAGDQVVARSVVELVDSSFIAREDP